MKSKNTSQDMVVILKPISSAFTISPLLNDDLSDLTDLPYRVPADDIEFTKLATLYFNRIKNAVNSGCSIIVMNYSILSAQMLKTLREEEAQIDASEWVFIAFFLEDKYLENAKLNEILSISEYPFIIKHELSFGFEITFNYLKTLYFIPFSLLFSLSTP